jgi:hypothetical protein
MTEILRNIEGNLLGLDKDDNLLIKGRKIILNHLGVEEEILASSPFTISGAVTDATGATEVNAYFTTLARRACGLNDDGTGTVGTAKPIFIAAGTYLLKAWNPTDASGYALPVTLFAYPGSAKIINRLSLSNVSSGAIDIDYSTWVSSQKVQASVTAITEGFSPATFGITTAASNDDTVTILTVADSTGFKPGKLAVICAQNNLPHTNSSSNKSRIGEAYRILNVDATSIYVQGRLAYHDFYETGIVITQYDTTRTFRAYGISFEGAATTIGLTTATPDQLDHGLFGNTTRSITSITSASSVATVTTAVAHGLASAQYVQIRGANEENYNVTVAVTVVDAATFTYTLPTKNDANTTFSTIPANVASPATGTLVYVDAFATLDTTALNACVTIRNGPGAFLEQCEFNFPWTMGVRFYSSPEWRVRNCNMQGLPNAGTNAFAFAGGRLGYGINIYGHSSNGVWDGGTVRNARHAVTTDGKTVSTYTPTDETSSSAWFTLGAPTHCLIRNVDSYDAWGIPFDTHEEGSDIVFKNCWAYSPQRGPQGGSYTGTGFQIRCRNVRIIDCGQKGGAQGIRVAATEQLGMGAGYSSSGTGPVPLTYTVSSLTQTAGVATFVHGTGNNSVNTGAHLSVGDIIRIRGANEENYNVTVKVLTYTESTKTGTFTMPTVNDLGATFSTAPSSATTPATGTITLQPFFRTQHVVQNFYCERLRKGKSGAILLDRLDSGSGITWKNKVLVNGLTIRGTNNGINADGGTLCDATNILASQMTYDSSSDQSGCVVGTLNTAVVHVGTMMLDVTDSVSNAPSIYPARLCNTSTITIGHLTLKQHPTYLACTRVFEDKDNATGKFAGLGQLVYDNPGALNPTTHFAIIQIGRESHYTWLFGGQQLSVPTQVTAITTSLVTVARMSVFNRFIIRQVGVIIGSAVAAGTVTVDVLLNGTTIFGASKVTVSAGATSSAANVPTYSKFLITDASELTVTVQSTSAETATLANVSLSGYWV